MTQDLAGYDAVVHAIYEAALKPGQWNDVVGRMAELFGASRAQMFTWTHRPSEGGFVFAHNIPQASLAIWDAKHRDEDPLVQNGMAKGLMVEGAAYNSHDLVPDETMFASSYYKNQWAPIDIARVCTGIVFDGTDAAKLPTLISLGRSLRAPLFDDSHVEMLRRLLKHLSRALGVMYHLRNKELQLAASLAALDQLGRAVVLLDADRRMTFANQAALALLQKGDLVEVQPATGSTPLQLRLHRGFSGLESRFQRLLTQALQPIQQDVGDDFSEALLLSAPDGRPMCVVHAAPLAVTHGFSTGGSHAKAIVFLYDLRAAVTVPPQRLCELFGMTPAEARAALQIARGGGLEEMAARLHVTVNTLKTQLKAAYGKSGAHRQVDLLKLLLALASP